MSTETKRLMDAVSHIDRAVIELQLISESILVRKTGNQIVYNKMLLSARRLTGIANSLSNRSLRRKLL